MKVTSLYKSLSDVTRLRCVALLMTHGELCVCELTYALDLPQPKISHHLANLRKVKLVSDRKEGLWIYYQINPDLPQWALDTLKAMAIGVKKEQQFIDDQRVLIEMPNRPTSARCA